MPTFKDSAGHEWQVAFDGLLLNSLRAEHGIDLADVLAAQYVQLERDPGLLTTALAHLCGEQLKAKNISPQQFSKAMFGPALEQGFAALWGAAEGFFPPKLWSALSSLYAQEKKQETLRQQMKQLGLLNEMPAEIRDGIYAQIGKTLPTFSSLISSGGVPSASGPEATPPTAASSSPDSAASTPAA
jgi:hypothetical protein